MLLDTAADHRQEGALAQEARCGRQGHGGGEDVPLDPFAGVRGAQLCARSDGSGGSDKTARACVVERSPWLTATRSDLAGPGLLVAARPVPRDRMLEVSSLDCSVNRS